MSNAVTAARLALMSYNDPTKEKHDGDFFRHLSEMFVAYTFSSQQVRSLQYYTVVDITNKNLYVVIRGTDTNDLKEQIRDLCVSFNMWTKKHEGRSYHRGFLNNGKQIYSDIKSLLNDQYDSGYNIIFTGHSLGGAIAKVLAQLFAKKCELYDFGSPRVMKEEFPNRNIKIHKSFVIYGDLIPSFPSNKFSEKISNTVLFDSMDFEDVSKYNIIYAFIKTILFGSAHEIIKKHSMKCYLKNVKRFEKK